MLLRVPAEAARRMDIYLPFVLVYFFFNSLFLPWGLLYTTALTPLFYIWLLRQNRRWVVTRFLIVLAPFVAFHLINGVEKKPYAISFALSMAIYIVAYTFYVFVNWTERLEEIFQRVILINFVFSCIGIVLYFTPWDQPMWRPAEVFTEGARVSRFQMFTYEPSYYCTLLAPLILWSFFRFARRMEPRTLAVLLMTVIPLLMSYSFGVILALVIAIGGVHIWHWRHVLKRHYMLVGAPIAALAGLYLLVSSNTFAARLEAFLSGQDSSGMVRTVLSYALAYFIAIKRSIWWGVGFGQIKVLGTELTEQVWGSSQGQLPCAIAETFAQFGFVGLALRLGLELYAAYRTKVWTNYFRLSLFIFIFVYQFTGSFMTNIAEYVIWILAFSPVFPAFMVEKAHEPVLAWFVPRIRVAPAEPEPSH